MSCLLPPFKCPPEAFSTSLRTHHNYPCTQLSKGKEPTCLRTQCVFSTVAPVVSATMTSVVDMEKLWVSLESQSRHVAAYKPLTYIGTMGTPSQVNLDATLASEEATIAAAAAEAVALAKAALRVAKDAALMVGNNSKIYGEHTVDLDRVHPKTADEIYVLDDPILSGNVWRKDSLIQNPIKEIDHGLEPTEKELELLEEQISESIAVRSTRQTERKERRTRAVGKAAANVVSVKSGSPSRRKRAAVQDIDYSDPLRYLRATTGRSKLLTSTEEHDLSEGIQVLLKLEKLQEELVERFGGQPTFVQWAAAAGIDQKTLRKRLSYGVLCKDKMIKSNIRLVISIAKNYQGVGMNLQDLVQEGCRGLLRGAEKFDASRGFKFSTYAHWWIKQAVRKSLSDQSRTIRLPFHMVEATYRVKEARKKLFSENGRHPANEEVAEATGLSMKRLEAVLMTPKAPRSLDQKIGFNMDLKPSEVISDPEAQTSEEILIKQLMKEDLNKMLNTLNPREKQVVRWRFGLEDGRTKTLQEIGELMGISRERVRQIESCAFRKLKNKRRNKQLHQYLVS